MGWKTETTCFKKESVTETTYDRFGPEIKTLGIINHIHGYKKIPIMSIIITSVKEDFGEAA